MARARKRTATVADPGACTRCGAAEGAISTVRVDGADPWATERGETRSCCWTCLAEDADRRFRFVALEGLVIESRKRCRERLLDELARRRDGAFADEKTLRELETIVEKELAA